MKKLMLVLVILSLVFSLCSCAPLEPEFFTDVGKRGNLAPCQLETTPEYILEQAGARVHVKLPRHKGTQGTVNIEKDNKVVFEGVIGETMSPDEYRGLLQKAGWAENAKLTSLEFNESTPVLRVFALMLEADYSLQGWYHSGRFGIFWTEVPLPEKGLAD